MRVVLALPFRELCHHHELDCSFCFSQPVALATSPTIINTPSVALAVAAPIAAASTPPPLAQHGSALVLRTGPSGAALPSSPEAASPRSATDSSVPPPPPQLPSPPQPQDGHQVGTLMRLAQLQVAFPPLPQSYVTQPAAGTRSRSNSVVSRHVNATSLQGFHLFHLLPSPSLCSSTSCSGWLA